MSVASARAARPVRVLVVDDSHFVRRALARLLASDPRVAVAGEAADGDAALDRLLALEPDVVTLDVEMPGQDGLATLEAIMRRRPTPVLMVSARTAAGAHVTLRALAQGAVDFVTKPDGSVSMDLGALRDELIAKVLAAASVRGRSLRPPIDGRRDRAPRPPEVQAVRRAPRCGVAIGASTGGVMALQAVLAKLRAPLEAPVFVAQHMPAHFTAAFAQLLEDSTGLPAREARDGEPVQPGRVYVAPGGRHLTVVAGGAGAQGARLCVSDEPAAITLRPSVNRLFESVARVYGAGAVAVVLTGMGNDGTDGLAAVKAAGGIALCQDESTSVVYGMPGSAVRAGLADVVAPVGRLGEEIGRAIDALARARR
ncbi:MAG TPA: chemotaxis response regulator protein-glutamate methylesterase [Thermodesulfobacteriota bacterium]